MSDKQHLVEHVNDLLRADVRVQNAMTDWAFHHLDLDPSDQLNESQMEAVLWMEQVFLTDLLKQVTTIIPSKVFDQY